MSQDDDFKKSGLHRDLFSEDFFLLFFYYLLTTLLLLVMSYANKAGSAICSDKEEFNVVFSNEGENCSERA